VRYPDLPYVPPPPEPEPEETGAGPRRYRIPQTEILAVSDSLGQSVSVAEARGNLADIVDAVERGERVQITRRGKPVAVMISVDEMRRLASPRLSFAAVYDIWRLHFEPQDLDLEPSHFDSLRDRSAGRDVKLG
jgi:prevent-host-death family protein